MTRSFPVLILAFIAAIILLCVPLDDNINSCRKISSLNDEPFYVKILGEGRSILSAISLIQADTYFHGGVYGEYGEAHCSITQRVHGAPDHDHDDDHGPMKIPRWNLLLRLSSITAVTEHVHLGDSEFKEIVPWLYYSTRIDPHNQTAFVLAGYYLEHRLDRPRKAITFLKEGLSKNPDSWQICGELGRIYFQRYKDYSTAIRYFRRARSLQSDTETDKFEKRYVLSYIAWCYEYLGDRKRELDVYEDLLTLFPDQEVFKDKIKGLRSN